MYFNARWYDPSLGRFAQADTDVPASQGVQGYDRYAYANNNPLYYTDPDGHFAIPAAVIIGVIVITKAIDYGWTAYDAWQSTKVLNDPTATDAAKALAAANLAMTAAFEAAEPDDVLPIGLPLDDLARHGVLKLGDEAVEHGDELVSLYRAVSKGELDDIMDTNIFRPKPDGKSMDTKWFWETVEGAKGWVQRQELDNIIEVKVPKNILELASERWSNLDRLGPAVGFIDEGLDAFNNSIHSIRALWR
jgi:hypothetical protein